MRLEANIIIYTRQEPQVWLHHTIHQKFTGLIKFQVQEQEIKIMKMHKKKKEKKYIVFIKI